MHRDKIDQATQRLSINIHVFQNTAKRTKMVIIIIIMLYDITSYQTWRKPIAQERESRRKVLRQGNFEQDALFQSVM